MDNKVTRHQLYQMRLIEEMKLSPKNGDMNRFTEPEYLKWKDQMLKEYEIAKNAPTKPFGFEQQDQFKQSKKQFN